MKPVKHLMKTANIVAELHIESIVKAKERSKTNNQSLIETRHGRLKTVSVDIGSL